MSGIAGDSRRLQRTPRMQALARLPIFLALDGKPAVVAGDGPPVAWKAELLSAAGAEVEVYASEPCEELLALAAEPPRGSIFIHRRAWYVDDIRGAAITIGACDSDEDAVHFAAAARATDLGGRVVMGPFDVRDAARKIKCPVLVVHPERDLVVPIISARTSSASAMSSADSPRARRSATIVSNRAFQPCAFGWGGASGFAMVIP